MYSRTVPLIEVSGDARERGRQHGEAARSQIHRSIEFYRDSFARASSLDWQQIQERAPRWIPLIEEYLPGITDELVGIAEGSDRTFEEILALNGRGELSYGNPFDESRDGCSSYALLPEATGDGHVYCGQNWDWCDDIADTVIMLHIEQPGKPTILQQVEAGQVGRQGANSAGIGLNANGLGARFGKAVGVPGPFVRRRILDSPTMYDALQAVFATSQAFSTNILLTHRDGFAIDVETTPGRHAWMYPTDGILVHANHFQAFIPPQIEGTYKPFAVDSLYRVPRIEGALRHCREAKSSAAVRDCIATAMRDHFSAPNSVCNHPDQRVHPLERSQTIASSIVDLTTGDYWVTAGLPCEHEYVNVSKNLYEVKERDVVASR